MIIQIHSVGSKGSIGVSFDAPDSCPLCHSAIQSIPFGQSFLENSSLQAVFRCPRPACGRLFIVRLRPNIINFNLALPDHWEIVAIEPKAHLTRSFDAEIAALSPAFLTIYGQASQAESIGLDQLCGPGYRKALEFLAKDYVKTLPGNVGQEETIEATQLGPCISKFVTDEKVRSCARRAVWLGNDETHYVRKWEDEDIGDLKKLIDLTLYWVSSEILTRDLEASMPDSNPRPPGR
jgi:hypothetical protein